MGRTWKRTIYVYADDVLLWKMAKAYSEATGISLSKLIANALTEYFLKRAPQRGE